MGTKAIMMLIIWSGVAVLKIINIGFTYYEGLQTLWLITQIDENFDMIIEKVKKYISTQSMAYIYKASVAVLMQWEKHESEIVKYDSVRYENRRLLVDLFGNTILNMLNNIPIKPHLYKKNHMKKTFREIYFLISVNFDTTAGILRTLDIVQSY